MNPDDVTPDPVVLQENSTAIDSPTCDEVPPRSERRAPIRWGGVIWGGLTLITAGWILSIVSSSDRLRLLFAWIAGLSEASLWALALAALGVFIVICAVLGGISATRRRRN